MSNIWQFGLFSSFLLIAISVQVECNCFVPTPKPLPQPPSISQLQLTRCVRSPQPTIHLIPAALYSNGQQHFISPLPFGQQQQQTQGIAQPLDSKRQTRQQQSAVVQQVTINQNTAISGGLPSFGFGGGGGFKHPFSSHHPHSFGSPHSFGGFRGRAYQKEDEKETSSSAITAPQCPLNYIFSCQPTVSVAPCGSNKPC